VEYGGKSDQSFSCDKHDTARLLPYKPTKRGQFATAPLDTVGRVYRDDALSARRKPLERVVVGRSPNATSVPRCAIRRSSTIPAPLERHPPPELLGGV
jgi:hypothetical protein